LKRHKKIALVAHCILNQNVVVYPLARAKGAFRSIVSDYTNNDYGLYQLPCPEFKYLGLSRLPMTKEDYSTQEYIDLCEQLVETVIMDLKKFRDDHQDITILHGINESPTCSISGEKGHFMSRLIRALVLNGFTLEYKEVAPNYNE